MAAVRADIIITCPIDMAWHVRFEKTPVLRNLDES
jgi:hypothetical protein